RGLMVPQFTGAAYFAACEPLAEAAGRVDRPLGDLRRDAKLVAQLTVVREAEARNEHPSQRGGEAVVDADVGRERSAGLGKLRGRNPRERRDRRKRGVREGRRW